jgi:hypothetical protein
LKAGFDDKRIFNSREKWTIAQDAVIHFPASFGFYWSVVVQILLKFVTLESKGEVHSSEFPTSCRDPTVIPWN